MISSFCIMRINKNKESHYRQLLSLTSLRIEEFTAVLDAFSREWHEYHQQYDLKGVRRKIPKFKEHADMSLRGSDDKLLFILIYMKQNPTQQYHGAMFDMSQGKVSQWIKILLPLFRQTLDRMQLLPERNADKLYMSLKVLAGYFILLDGTERPIPRPVDNERQEYYYSGKKGYHTIKNNLIINKEQQVLYLSPTVEGKLHDKRLAEEMELEFPSEGVLMQDLGYLGFEPGQVKVVMPEKRKRNQTLSSEDKAYNKLISSVRITVEHAIGSIKRLRIVQEKIRLRMEGTQDQVMLIATGLHNLRRAYRNLS